MPVPPFGLDNSYARELPGVYVAWKPDPVPAPRLLFLNAPLAGELGLDAVALAGPDGAALFAGNLPNPRRKLRAQFPISDPDVVLGLQVQPEPGLHAEEQPEPQRGVRGDGALAIDQFADPARRDVDVRRELARADAHGLHEILQQDLAGVNLFEQPGHVRHACWSSTTAMRCAPSVPSQEASASRLS